MVKKILIAEDVDATGFGLENAFDKQQGIEIVHARYCDEALLKIRKAILDQQPFDLLLTDLSFVPDHRKVTLHGGEELIAAVRAIQPEIKILVYSIEDRIYKIRSLFRQGINGFVWKGRQSTPEVLRAVTALSENEEYLSPRFSHIFNPSSALELSEYDLTLIKLLAEGYKQDVISEMLKEAQLSGSTSSIEKALSRLRISFKAKNNVQLVSIARDLGLL